MKTMYDTLEVSKTASKEVIEKAYKVLAKRYHPDLQPAEGKEKAEKQMKEINEAYEILSDDTKRREYDTKLEIEEQSKQENQQMQEEYFTNSQAQNNYSSQESTQRPMTEAEYKQREKEEIKQQQNIQKNIQAKYEQKYQQAYEGYLRNLGYKIRYKWTWKNYRDFLITILVIAIICAILWFFPPTHKLIMDFYNSNNIIRTIINVIGGVFVGIWNAICSIFK